MWPAALSAKLKPLWAFVNRAYGRKSHQNAGTDTCHIVYSTIPTPLTDVTPNLERRALMLHNRNREAAEKYLRRHQTLSKGACSNE